MPSTDINGEPIFIIGVLDAKILLKMLDIPNDVCQTSVMDKLVKFLNETECLEWVEKHENIN